MVNRLATAGLLLPADAEWVRRANERATAAYPDPSRLQPSCYDPGAHPGARAWFKSSARALLAMTEGYLDVLDRYDVAWVELRRWCRASGSASVAA